MKNNDRIDLINIKKVNINKVELIINLIVSKFRKYINNLITKVKVHNFITKVCSYVSGFI